MHQHLHIRKTLTKPHLLPLNSIGRENKREKEKRGFLPPEIMVKEIERNIAIAPLLFLQLFLRNSFPLSHYVSVFVRARQRADTQR